MRRSFLCLFWSLIFTVAFSDAAEPNFFVEPIRTELQREQISSQSSAYAIVYCNPLVADGKLNLETFDTEAFVTKLQPLSNPAASLYLKLRYEFSNQPISDELKDQLKSELVDLCRDAGFKHVRPRESRTSAKWSDVCEAAKFEEQDEATEDAVDNELVTAFPIRTRLSKFAIANADCIIEIKRPIDGRMVTFPTALYEKAGEAVSKLKLTSKDLLMFDTRSTRAGRDRMEEFFSGRKPPRPFFPGDKSFAVRQANYKASPGMLLAMDLGFKGTRYRHSPGGGAPEERIGKDAPDFELELLDGSKVQFREFIDGHPSLLTFWGVACGPCCMEAPHLSTLNAKFADRGFRVLAVNGYDESREVVSKYVAKAGLTHPIALQGGEVSRQVYDVGAYPTTFWIDESGKVVDYVVGFQSAETLEEHALKLLGQEPAPSEDAAQTAAQ